MTYLTFRYLGGTMQDLEFALDTEPVGGNLPIALPLGHLAPFRGLASILAGGNLTPQPCKVLGGKLVYLSYGGVFYRQRSTQSESETELPVAFVFSPALLDEVNRIFPFDTGGMGNKIFGDEWALKLAPFETKFGVTTSNASETGSKLVHHLYDTNKSYLHGAPKPHCTATTDPLPLLHEFLSQDLSGLSADHRQRAIECLCEVQVPLAKYLHWIGFPSIPGRSIASTIDAIYNCTRPNMPQFYAYEYHQNFNPLALAETLEVEARKQVTSLYLSVHA